MSLVGFNAPNLSRSIENHWEACWVDADCNKGKRRKLPKNVPCARHSANFLLLLCNAIVVSNKGNYTHFKMKERVSLGII